MFWFKRKEIVVDFFIDNEKVNNLYSPRKASSFIPNWWKKLPNSHDVHVPQVDRTKQGPTMKFCSGFKDLYGSGFIIPLWSDLDIHVTNETYYWVFADGVSDAHSHSAEQYGNNFPDFYHIKIISPWLVREKTGIKFAFLEPFWSLVHLSKNIRIPPAVVSYDLQPATNINAFILKKPDEYKIQIEAGDPIVHFIPLTDKRIKIKTHVLTKLEHASLKESNRPTKFFGSFEQYKRFVRKNEGK